MNGKNSLTAKVIVSFATAAILILVFVIFGCYRQGETDSTGTTSEPPVISEEPVSTDSGSGYGTSAIPATSEEPASSAESTSEIATSEEITTVFETEEPLTTEEPAPPPSEEKNEFTLSTKNATLKLKASDRGISVTSLKTKKNSYVTSSQLVSLPDVGKALTYTGAKAYTGEKGTGGFVFTYSAKGVKYDLYVVSNSSYSGPFEFYGILSNTGNSGVTVRNGSYFDLGVKFAEAPTATTFRKESGVAEGWKIYNGVYYSGSGIYTTELGKTGQAGSSTEKCVKINRSPYTAIFFWTGIKDTDTHTITFYAKGTKGEKFLYGYEAAHATIDGQWQPAVRYDVDGSYTFQKDNEWEPVTLNLKSANQAGTDKNGKVWNTDHQNNGFPLYIYTTTAEGNPFWIDEVTINGAATQSFNGSSPADGSPFGSWVPGGNQASVELDANGYSGGGSSTGYGKAVASYTTNQDWNAGGDISMMYIDTGSQGLYFAQDWSNGKLTAQGGKSNTVALNAMLGTGSFTTSVPAGGSMLLPSVYVGVYDGDIETGSNLYKRWFFNVKAPDNMVSDPNEPLTQQDMQIGNDVSKYGIQSIKWDYGWWTDRAVGSWKAYEGLLDVRSTVYMNAIGGKTLKEFVDDTNSKGVKLAMYILLKDTQLDEAGVPTSVGSNGHPEWFSDRVVTVCPSADLGNAECVAFYQKYMYDFFSKNGVTTWRSDFEPICRSSNKSNRHAANGTDVQYWCTVGFGELVDYLTDNIKGFRYESCSSGGSMKDLFTMTKASVINCADSADYMSLHMSFYDSSYCIHPAQLQLPINSLTYCNGSDYYTGSADFMYGLRCQMTGAVMLSNWVGTNSGQARGETRQWMTTIKVDYNEKLKPLIRNGDMYHILGRPDGRHWDGIEYVDLSAKDIKGAIMLWKPAAAPSNSQTVYLRGLNASATYKLSFTDRPDQGCTMTGKQLMEEGLTVIIPEKVGSEIIYITKG